MFSFSFFKGRIIRSRTAATPKLRRSFRPQFETLEDRVVPATTLYVDNTPDTSLGAGHHQFTASGGSQSNVSDLTLGVDLFSTIQEAIDAAGDGDTINVADGTYSELVNVNKDVSVLGNQFGVNAPTRSGTESIVNGSVNGNNRTTSFYITHSGATVDGFTVQGQSDSNQFGAGIVMSASTSGVTVSNNIVTNNAIGIFAGSSGASLIEHNLIDGNNTVIDGDGNVIPSGGAGIYTESTSSLTIDANEFRNQTQNNPVIFAAVAPGDHANVTFKNNYLHDNAYGVFALAISGGLFQGNTIKTSGGGATALTFGGAVSGVDVLYNDLSGNLKGLRIADYGYYSGTPNSDIEAHYNDFSNSSVFGAGISDENEVFAPDPALTDGYTGTLDLSKNWWGDVSGPMSTANPGGLGEVLRNDFSDTIIFRPWLVYSPDSNSSQPGVQLPTTVTVTAGNDVSAAENDFTLLQNAVGAVVTGQTLDLTGDFDWTASHAAAAYAASTNTSDTADIRGVELPTGVNNVTITSSGGDAHILGRGDFEDVPFDAFLFADDSTSANGGANAVGNTNFILEKLSIDDFESAAVFGWNGTGAFNGTRIRNNLITIGGDSGDNSNSLSNLQNIAIYFAAGQGQQITGNTITFQADGTRAVGSGARSFGFQNNTTGGALYDNLLIDNNTFQLATSSTGVEIVYGIWENGHNDDNTSDIDITNNKFLGRQGVDDFDRALMLTSQTDNLVIDGNTFTDVDNVYFARNAAGGTDPGDEFTFTNNVLTRVGGADGIFLRNVTEDATPVHVVIHWNINNTIDGETGVRGLNELSTQATHASRPNTAASDIDSVIAAGAKNPVFVDDSWVGAGRFTDPDGIGAGAGPVAFGFNGFTTIQAGINGVDAGGTVNVLAGAYVENVLVNKSVQILGPNAGVSGSGVRGAEAVVVTNGNQFGTTQAVFTISASDITISGLTITGDDPSVSGAAMFSGADANTLYGVRDLSGGNNVTVRDNIIKNLFIGVRGDGASNGNLITDNYFTDIGVFDFGYGITLRTGYYANITNNVMERVYSGVHINDFSVANVPNTWTLSGNDITSYAAGLWFNQSHSTATPLSVTNNQFTAEAGPVANNIGILITNGPGAVGGTYTGNTITGYDYGVIVWNTSATVTLGGTNSIVNSQKAGVYLTNFIGFNPITGTALNLAATPSTVVLDGISVTTTNTAADGVRARGDASGGISTLTVRNDSTVSGGNIGIFVLGPNATATIQNNDDSIHGNTIGIDVDGGSASITGNRITANGTGIHVTNGGTLTAVSNNFITGQLTSLGTGRGIDIESTAGTISAIFNNDLSGNQGLAISNGKSTDVNASGNWFGINTAAGVLAKVSAKVDYTPWLNLGADTGAAAGFQGDFSNLHVDDDSPQVGATGRITEAIGLLDDSGANGGRINVHSGTYTEDVNTSTKKVTLALGAGPGQVTINGNLTLDGNDTFEVDIADYAVGSGHDQGVVNGTVSLGGATLVVIDTLGNPVTLGSVFRIIDNDPSDAVNGTFTIPGSAVGPDGVTRFFANGHAYEIYYDFGTAPHNGNDVVLRLDQNDAPVITAPVSEATGEDVPLVFSSANGNAISFSDSDVGTADVQVTLHVTHGTLTLNGTNGLSFLFNDANGTGQGDGTADATMTFRGSLADINTALNGLTYTPNPNYNGSDTLELTVNDLGHTGPPGPQTSFGGVLLTVVNTDNDAPVAPNRSITINEEAAVSGTLTATDPENAPVTFNVTDFPDHGTLNYDANTGAFTYSPNANYNGPDSFKYTASDGVNTSTEATVSITITSINDAPEGADKTVTTNEDVAYTFTTADFGFTDPNDSPANNFNRVKITTTPVAGTLQLNNVTVNAGAFVTKAQLDANQLKFTPALNANGNNYASFTFQVEDDGGTNLGGVNLDQSPNAITINVTSVNDAPEGINNTVTTNEDTVYTFNATDFTFTDPNDTPPNNFAGILITTTPANGTLKLGATTITSTTFVSKAQIDAGQLTFTPAPQGNGSPYANFFFQVQDDGGAANGGLNTDIVNNVLTINVTAVNDAPAGADKTVSTNEDTDYTFTAADFGFSDPNDTPANAFSAVKVTSTPTAGTLKLNGLAINAGDFVTVAQLNTGNLKFTPAANANGTNYATFTFQVQDDGGIANGGVNLDQSPNTITVNVTSVNDAPAGTDKTVTTNEDTTYTFTAADFGFTDPNDTPANNFAAVKITSTPAVGTLKLNGVDVSAGQFITKADLDAGNLKFTPAANVNGSPYTTFTFQVQDDGGGANLDQSANTITINVAGVNDAPVNTVPGSQITSINTPLVFSGASQISISDLDAGGSLVQVTLTVSHGTLTLSGTSGLTFSFADVNGVGQGDGTADSTMTFRGSLANVNAALNGLTYQPTIGYSGPDTLTVTTNDLGNTGSGGALSDADSVSLTVIQNFQDNFNRSNSSTLGSSWTTQLGSIGIASNTAQGSAAVNLATVTGLSAADVSMQVQIGSLATSGQLIGLVARYSGPGESNEYHGLVYNSNGTARAAIYRNVGGTWTLISADVAVGSVAAVAGSTLRFEVQGSSQKLFLNNTLVAFSNDTAITGTGGVGIRTFSNAALDNFQSTLLPAPANGSLGTTFTFESPQRPDAQLDNVWTERLGNFAVTNVSGNNVATGNGTDNLATLNGVSGADVVVQAQVRGLANGELIGLSARYSGPGMSNQYQGILYNSGGTARAVIYRNVGGTWTMISADVAVGSIASVVGGTLRFEVQGSSLKLFLGNTLVAFSQDTAISGAGAVAMRTVGTASLDNFRADLPPAPANGSLGTTYTFESPQRPDGQLDNVWKEQIGNFKVANVSGNNVALGNGSDNLATLNGINATNLFVQAQVKGLANGELIGLSARYSGPGMSNQYQGILYNSNGTARAVIYRNVGGVWTMISSDVAVGSIASVLNSTLRFELTGSSLKLFVGGNLVTSATDTAITGPGGVGMRLVGSASLDNFATA